MSWTKTKQSTLSLIYAAAVVSLAAVGLWIGVHNNKAEANTKNASNNVAPAATFAGTGVGAIPDGGSACAPSPGAARDVTFATSGLSGSVSTVDISMTFGSPVHTFIGDVVATLIAPNGTSFTVFGRTGATTANSVGGSSDLGATYVFSDSAAAPPSGGWWQEEAVRDDPQIMTAGTYRTTQLGGAGTTNPAPATSMNPAFTGVTNANGTWTLRLTDGCQADTGAITAANLSVTTAAPTATPDANVDFNGDGKTDFVIARATTTPLTQETAPSLAPIRQNVEFRAGTKTRIRRQQKSDNLLAPPIYWYTSFNGSGTTGVGQLGDALTDFLTPEDFDGDGKDDLAVWTEAAAGSANFKILQSSTNTVVVQFFGQTADDPAVVGDYDGDGKADPAVFRCPGIADPAGQCYFFYRGSLNNPSGTVTFVPWGFGNDGDYFPYVGDFDGDGKSDFCLQRADPSNTAKGQFVLLKSNGLGTEFINWGLSSDFLIPGDYDGDGKTDFCVRRDNTPNAGQRTFFILTRTGATGGVQWGLNNDIAAPGDYDGDGKTDFAVWRGSTTPGDSRFWILNSSNGSVTQFIWGQCATPNTCDTPAAGWAVH